MREKVSSDLGPSGGLRQLCHDLCVLYGEPFYLYYYVAYLTEKGYMRKLPVTWGGAVVFASCVMICVCFTESRSTYFTTKGMKMLTPSQFSSNIVSVTSRVH